MCPKGVLKEQSFNVLSLAFVRCFSLPGEHPDKFMLLSSMNCLTSISSPFPFVSCLQFPKLLSAHFLHWIFKNEAKVGWYELPEAHQHTEKQEASLNDLPLGFAFCFPGHFLRYILGSNLLGSRRKGELDLIFYNFVSFPS